MAFEFDKAFNKFAKAGTSLNRGLNKVIGKEVFQDIKEIERPHEFPPFDSFPAYSVPEPAQWAPLSGEAREFSLNGNIITVPANLDACIQYRNGFKSSAKYYMERFAFKYQNCVQDYDTLIHYFKDLYFEGLRPMLNRAYSLLLPFGVFNTSLETFTNQHVNTYRKAVNSYETMVGIEASKNQAAQQAGNLVGGSVRMQGGGFGLKGAMKGIAQAEVFNAGMGLLGKYVTNQTKMTPEEKANAFALFKHEVFFQEVYSDYFNTFLTLVQILNENNELDGISTIIGSEYQTMMQNLQNPMFPQDKIVPAFVKLISAYPFAPATFNLLQEKVGQTSEVNQIVSYFVG